MPITRNSDSSKPMSHSSNGTESHSLKIITAVNCLKSNTMAIWSKLTVKPDFLMAKGRQKALIL